MNQPKEAICFKQHNNHKNSISEIFLINISQFLKCIMWLNALRLVSCKFSVDAFSLLYSKLLLAKLCLFVFCATFAEWHGNLLAYVAALFVFVGC